MASRWWARDPDPARLEAGAESVKIPPINSLGGTQDLGTLLSSTLISISTRRFWARPSADLLSATGSFGPRPRVLMVD